MKKPQLILISVIALGVIVYLMFGNKTPDKQRHTTPQECLEVYYEACVRGDVEQYLLCLGEPLRSNIDKLYPESSTLSNQLKRSTVDFKNWVRKDDPIQKNAHVEILVEESHISGKREVHFTLSNDSGNWRIVKIDTSQVLPHDIPYNTHISREP